MTRSTTVLAGAQITQLCDHRGPGRHFPAIAPNGGPGRIFARIWHDLVVDQAPVCGRGITVAR